MPLAVQLAANAGPEVRSAVVAALGALTLIPCAVAGTSTLALTPLASTPTVSAYTQRQFFSGVAASSNAGGVGGMTGFISPVPDVLPG